MKCLVCKKERETYNLRIEISGPIAGNKYDHFTEVCPECGFMQLKGAGTEHIKCLSKGFPEIKDNDLSKLKKKINEILDEMVMPNKWENEIKVWLTSDFNKWHKYGDARADDYEAWFGIHRKYRFYEERTYHRLVHFLLMDTDEREKHFGKFNCSSMDVSHDGHVGFEGGYHRFLLLKFLGAKTIPVAMLQESIDNAKANGIPIFNSRS